MEKFIDYTQSSGETSGDLSNYYTKGQVNTIVANNNVIVSKKPEIELGYKLAYNSNYKELTSVDGKLTMIEIWVDSGKGTKLFTKIFQYKSYGLEAIITTDEVGGSTMTQSFTYQDGKIISISKTYGGM